MTNDSSGAGDSVYSYRFSKFVVLTIAILALVALLILLWFLRFGGLFGGLPATGDAVNAATTAALVTEVGETGDQSPEPVESQAASDELTAQAATETPLPPPSATATPLPQPSDTPQPPTVAPPSDTPDVTAAPPSATATTPATVALPSATATVEEVAEVIPTATDTPLPPLPTATDEPTDDQTVESPTTAPTVTPTDEPPPPVTPETSPPTTEEPQVVVVEPAADGNVPPGRVTFSGTGPPGTQIEIFVDGEPVATTTVDESGQWTASVEQGPEPGNHEVRAEARDDSGEPVAESDATNITVLEAMVPTTGSEDLPWSVMLLVASALASLGLVFALGGKILRAMDRMRHN